MAIIKWDPFADINNLHNQMSDLFSDSFGDLMGHDISAPVTDIYDDDKSITVEVHLPHFKQEEITVSQNEGSLEINANHSEKSTNNKKYLHKESATRYYRRFTLPKNTDLENIKADFDNGLLTVSVPYKELPKPKTISISAKSKK